MTSPDIAVAGKAATTIIISALGFALTPEYISAVFVALLVALGSLSFQAYSGIEFKHLFLGVAAVILAAAGLYYYHDLRPYIYITEMFIILLPDESIGVLKVVAKKVGLVK